MQCMDPKVYTEVYAFYAVYTATPLREGEIVLLKDGSVATDWYCAQVLKVLPTHIVVHYYTTQCPPHEDYAKANHQDRKNLNFYCDLLQDLVSEQRKRSNNHHATRRYWKNTRYLVR